MATGSNWARPSSCSDGVEIIMSANPNATAGAWALEVVRGAELGRRYALGPGLAVLGRGPLDRRGIDLSGQEGTTLRPMEARHASLEVTPSGPVLSDLQSAGGTFVNRRRVLPGQGLPLQPGDVIQLGSVQLRLVSATARPGPTPTSPRPGPRPAQARPPSSAPGPAAPFAFAFALPDGATIQSWDDFLTLSAQRWGSIRDELTSGRLAAFLDSIGRSDLRPKGPAGASADERLDTWLGSLPTTKASGPELDVHPGRLLVRATPGGGMVRRVVQVSNLGHRLLRSTARVEPPGLAWLKLAAESPAGPFTTVEGTSLAVEIAAPDALPRPLQGELVIEGNGGTRRVAVILEAKTSATDPLDVGSDLEHPSIRSDSRLLSMIGRQPPLARIATWGLVALALRLLIGVAGGAIGEDAMTPSGPDSPALARVGLAFAIGSAILGATLARLRGGIGEMPTGGFAGACLGLIVASALVAACRSVEPMLGSWSSSVVAVCLLWAALGAGLAAASIGITPKETP